MSRHVHIHLGRKTAERLATTRTTDADGEGKWVTINGTHVQIGAGGKITKGPAALKGKSRAEAHQAAGAEHLVKHDEAKKRGDLDQAKKHLEASAHHTNAGEHFKQGNAELGEHKAKEAEAAHAATQTVHTAKPKPQAHTKLHAEAGKTVAEKGAKKHQDEHAKLLGRYDNSKADWERSAVNRQIERNAGDAASHHTDKLEQKARASSAAAHASGKPEDHAAAAKALADATDAHGRTGGVGYAKKQEELTAMRKGHEAAGKKTAEADQQHPDAPPIIAKHPAYNKADYEAAMTAGKTNEEHYGDLQKKAKPSPGKGNAYINDPSKPLPKRTTPIAGDQQADFKKAAEASKNAGGDADKQAHTDKAVQHHHLGNTAAELKQREAHKAAASAHKDALDAHGKPSYAGKRAAAEQASAKADKLGFKPSHTVTQQAHSDAAESHRAKAKQWANPAHGQHEEGAKEVAAMHEEAAKHHDHMVANPDEDHSARGEKLRTLNKQIGVAEGHVQSGKGHKVTGKPAPSAPASASKGKGGGGSPSSSVQGATEALKGLKQVVKKTGEAADPDPKKQG